MLTILLIFFGLAFFAGLSYKNRMQGFAVLLFALPLYVVRFHFFGLPTTLLEIMILIYLAVFWYTELKSKTIRLTLRDISGRLVKTRIIIPVALFALASCIAVFVASDKLGALGLWRAYILEPLLLFITTLALMREERFPRIAMYALGFSAAAVGVMALVQYLTGWGIPDAYNLAGMRRATALYGFPGAVGLYVGPILAFFLGYELVERSPEKKIKYIQWFIILGSVAGLVSAGNKGAMFGVLVALLALVLLTRYRWWGLALTLVLVVALFLVPVTRDKLVPIVTFRATSGDVRVVLWQGTGNLIAHNPIFGSGLGGFPDIYPQYKEAKHTEFLQYPHNIFLNFWTEMGILGLFSFVLLAAYFLLLAFRKARMKERSIKKWGFGLLAFLVALCVAGLVDVPYFKNDLAVLWWVVLAIALIPLVRTDRRTSDQTSSIASPKL